MAKRHRRVLTFSEELALALRQKFAPLWHAKTSAADGNFAARVLHHSGRIESVLKWVELDKHLLDQLLLLPPLEGINSLNSFPIEKLIEETRGLNALAQKLREQLKAAPPPPSSPKPDSKVTRPLAETDLDGSSMGWLRKLFRPASIKQLPEAPVSPPTEQTRKRQAFEAVLDYAAQLLAFVSPRMHLISTALIAAGIPGPKRPWPELQKDAASVARKASIPPGQLEWVPALAELFHSRSEIAQRAQVVEHQHKGVNEQLEKAQTLQASLASAAPSHIPSLLEQFHVERFRGMMIPLTNLHVTFKGVPLLTTLFPPPSSSQ